MVRACTIFTPILKEFFADYTPAQQLSTLRMFQNYHVYDKELFSIFAETVRKTLNDREAFTDMVRVMHPVNGRIKPRNFELLDVLDYHFAQNPDETPFDERLIEMAVFELLDKEASNLTNYSTKKTLMRGVYPHLLPTSDKQPNCAAYYSKILSLLAEQVEASTFDS